MDARGLDGRDDVSEQDRVLCACVWKDDFLGFLSFLGRGGWRRRWKRRVDFRKGYFLRREIRPCGVRVYEFADKRDGHGRAQIGRVEHENRVCISCLVSSRPAERGEPRRRLFLAVRVINVGEDVCKLRRRKDFVCKSSGREPFVHCHCVQIRVAMGICEHRRALVVHGTVVTKAVVLNMVFFAKRGVKVFDAHSRGMVCVHRRRKVEACFDVVRVCCAVP